METMNKYKRLSKTLKFVSILWFINLAYFTASLWGYYYCDSIGFWAANPLQVMMVSSGLMKILLSILTIATYTTRTECDPQYKKEW
jgi:hypothetical protein